jgi:mannose-6-phosphate isomerase-like protein (cupin superfamily)
VPITRREDALVYEVPNATFTVVASPRLGARDTCVWRLVVPPGIEAGAAHSFDHEEVLYALSGRAEIWLDEEKYDLSAGEAAVIPAGVGIRLGNLHAEPFEAVVSLPVGTLARMPDGTTSIPFVAA